MPHPEIDLQTINEWQDIADLVVELTGSTCALIMRKNEDEMEVFTSSSSHDSPYKPGVVIPLNTDLYSETVVADQAPLHITNGRKDPRWKDCLDLELGLIFYYGVPINWPDNTPFGAFCILDRIERTAFDAERTLVYRFSKSMEQSLNLLHTRELLQQNSIHDLLTKIPNRYFFLSQLQKEFSRAKRYGQPLCLTSLNLDFLQRINEEHSISVGDEVLRFFAEVLADTVRQGDLVARMSGETFALLTPGIKLEQAIQLVERIRQVIEERKQDSPVPDLHFSAGIAEFNVGDTNFEDLIKRTDNVLHMAKSRGRNRTCY